MLFVFYSLSGAISLEVDGFGGRKKYKNNELDVRKGAFILDI